MAFIEISGVEFSYPGGQNRQERKVLTGIDLQVEKGEFLAVIGPNGSGKSTLVKHFNGLLIPTSGSVTIDGMDTAVQGNLQEIRRRVGMLFQNPENQLVSPVVEEDVAFGPENLCIPPAEIRTRVEKALAAVGMAEYRKKPVHDLSGGQKQRVAIAGLLAMEPECLVLDEPTSMLDPVGRKMLYEILLKLKKKGITVIVVTHHMEEAVFADRVCIFNKGKILLAGSPGKVFSDPGFLAEQNLDVPEIPSLTAGLREKGFDIPANIYTLDEMVEFICTYRQRS